MIGSVFGVFGEFGCWQTGMKRGGRKRHRAYKKNVL
jgi:hypothetical protein